MFSTVHVFLRVMLNDGHKEPNVFLITYMYTNKHLKTEFVEIF